jgi:hypothetical protein
MTYIRKTFANVASTEQKADDLTNNTFHEQASDGKGKRERLAIGKNEKNSSESTKKDATKAAKTEPQGSGSGWPVGLNSEKSIKPIENVMTNNS